MNPLQNARRKKPITAERMEELLGALNRYTDAFGSAAAFDTLRRLKRLGKVTPEEARAVGRLYEYVEAKRKARGKRKKRKKIAPKKRLEMRKKRLERELREVEKKEKEPAETPGERMARMRKKKGKRRNSPCCGMPLVNKGAAVLSNGKNVKHAYACSKCNKMYA